MSEHERDSFAWVLSLVLEGALKPEEIKHNINEAVDFMFELPLIRQFVLWKIPELIQKLDLSKEQERLLKFVYTNDSQTGGAFFLSNGYGREDRTMYELILPLIDSIISYVKEFEYKWKFLFELPQLDLSY